MSTRTAQAKASASAAGKTVDAYPGKRADAATQARHARGRAPAPLHMAGNLAIQALNGLADGALTLGGMHDPAEREADRTADAVLHGNFRGRPGGPAVAATDPGPLASDVARPLTIQERAFFEPRFGADLGHVRIHDGAGAAASAALLGASAFSLGSRIALGTGHRQDGGEPSRLLAHELAHVLAPGDGKTIRRQVLANSASAAPVCKAEPEEQVCKAPEAADPANPTALNLTGTVDQRVAAFKQLVKTTAVHRLLDNRRNLGAWAALVESRLPSGDLAAMGMKQTGASTPYFELQDIRDPMLRELRAAQALGRFRACTGCHIQKDLWATSSEREANAGGWSTPNEMRASMAPAAPAYQPPAGSQEARLHGMFPDPAATRAALERAAPILAALGPDGYKVLPGDLLAKLEKAGPDKVRGLIIDAIKTRQGNYTELIGKINNGEIGYESFGPVIRKLMPLADADVRTAIQTEMDTRHFWEKVEEVVVGAMTGLALLLAIFPPTSMIGIAFFAALELSLGYYGVTKGNEAMRLGQAYGLGVGAHDVFTPEQQEAADAMVLNGFISAATGWLGIAGGLARSASLASHLMSPVAGAAPLAESAAMTGTGGAAARTVERGEYVITIAGDGSMVVTAASRPDLLIIVKGELATLYQLLEGGGMRVVARATMPRGGPPPTSTPLLSSGAEPGALMAGAEPLPPLSAAEPMPFPVMELEPMPLLPESGAAAPLPFGGAVSPPLLDAAPGPIRLPASSLGAHLADGAGGFATPPPKEPLITPPPPVYLQLNPGAKTTYTWSQISEMAAPDLAREREIYMRQINRSSMDRYFRVLGTGGRYVDVPVWHGRQLFAGEVKAFQIWKGGRRYAGRRVPNQVPLSSKIKEQITRDVWLRDNYPGYDPRWLFTDAPPAEKLRQALRDAGIIFIEYGP